MFRKAMQGRRFEHPLALCKFDLCRLLDAKAQESFYNKIVARYMQFCSLHSKDLDDVFASLSLNGPPASAAGQDFTLRPGETRPLTPSPPKAARPQQSTTSLAGSIPANELSIILTALRKLREGLLASSANAPSPVFAQRVHVFNIRLAILAQSPESYHPSLLHLLSTLHSPEHPLPKTELFEMTAYLILHLATRQNDLGSALALRYNSRRKFGFGNRNLDMLLRSITTNDWILFWSTRRKVDGYVRAILHFQAEKLRKTVLKAIGRSYMSCDISWILQSATGNELEWEELVKNEAVGWIRDGDKAIIRKPKVKPS
jgi:hypothetical protein